jgi:hypothetical protein
MNNFAFLPPGVLRYFVGFMDTCYMIKLLRSVCKNWKIALANDSLKANHGLEEIVVTFTKESYQMYSDCERSLVCFVIVMIKLL